VYFVIVILYVGGAVATWIAATHSIKRRVVAGQDFGALDVFTWYLGWAVAAAFTLGLGTMVYAAMNREAIRATAQRQRDVMAAIRELGL